MIPPVRPRLTLSAQPDFDLVHRYSAWLERNGKAEATIEAYHADVADLVRAFAPRRPAELMPHDVRTYLAGRSQAEQWAPATVRRHLQAIKSFYRYLVGEERLRAPGPAERLAEPVVKPDAPLILSEAEVAVLFGYLESAARGPAATMERMDLALYGLCYFAALLVSEAVGLTVDAVRGWPTALHLTVVGRGGTRSHVTLDGDPAQWLSTWIAERPHPFIRAMEPFVFIHPRSHVHTSRQRAWHRLRQVARTAGLGEEMVGRLGPHTLRHSYAAHLAARAAGVGALREALRQRSPRHAAKYITA
ncbi:MAG TPA: phage integrase N-terminal SAM-like domain-containing protein [Gemmatimonadaceae bacterium]